MKLSFKKLLGVVAAVAVAGIVYMTVSAARDFGRAAVVHPVASAAKPPVPPSGPDPDLLRGESGSTRERFRVPLGTAVKGPADAAVTIVQFADFECEFSAEMKRTLDELSAAYPGKLRVAFHHFPLNEHPAAFLASEAGLAAEAQGKFWEMHDVLFKNRAHLQSADLEKHAATIGLDMTRFRNELKTHEHRAKVDNEIGLAQEFGVEGTPTLFVNGIKLEGAINPDALKWAVDGELNRAKELLAEGVAPKDLYDASLRGARGPGSFQMSGGRRGPRPDPLYVHKVSLGTLPPKGKKDAVVFIVAFSDHLCAECRQTNAVLSELLKMHPEDLAVVWRDLHQPNTPSALAAAAGRAAAEQNKFWEMSDLLATAGPQLDKAAVEAFARRLKLNVARFRAALDSTRVNQRIAADLADANRFGVYSAPGFYVNGKILVGPSTVENFSARIAEAMESVKPQLALDVERGPKMHDVLTRGGLIRAGKAGMPWNPSDDFTMRTIELGKAPVRGPEKAPVNVVVFAGFECPYSRQLAPILTRLESMFKGKLRLAWKHLPLEEHANGALAAEAALEAQAQGRFWEMQEKLYLERDGLSREAIDRAAARAGLDKARLQSALDTHRHKDRLAEDMRQAEALELEGTPVVFVNGRIVPGAYPIETFAELVTQELREHDMQLATRERRTP